MAVIVIPEKDLSVTALPGETLLDALRRHGIYPDAPCGGSGKCGKCKVIANGTEVLACRTAVDRLPEVYPYRGY